MKADCRGASWRRRAGASHIDAKELAHLRSIFLRRPMARGAAIGMIMGRWICHPL